MTSLRNRLIALLMLMTSVAASGASAYIYPGTFSHESATGAECAALFTEKKYDARLHILGPTGRTAVLNFQSPSEKGFFHNLTLVGNLGFSNDIRVTKSFGDTKSHYDVVASGVVDGQILALTVSVKVRPQKGVEPLCEGRADFSAF